ncbi:MAG: hypothetical protein ACREXU_18025, partial [Gammaproteobacteria bacterium]
MRLTGTITIGHKARQRLIVLANDSDSDALVIFGISGDLAFKKIIPSIYNLVRRGRLAGAVIGVAREQWSLQRLRERIDASVRAQGN